MYNSLKEIKEALKDIDLDKYVNIVGGKAPEEIVDILKKDNIDISLESAKECVDYLKDSSAIEDKELENVAGGTCFSSGVTDPETGINRKYAVVTFFNGCPWNKYVDWGFCGECSYSFKINGETMYCRLRWEGHNTPDAVTDINGTWYRFLDDPNNIKIYINTKLTKDKTSINYLINEFL